MPRGATTTEKPGTTIATAVWDPAGQHRSGKHSRPLRASSGIAPRLGQLARRPCVAAMRDTALILIVMETGLAVSPIGGGNRAAPGCRKPRHDV